jgi:hypothetical protein
MTFMHFLMKKYIMLSQANIKIFYVILILKSNVNQLINLSLQA